MKEKINVLSLFDGMSCGQIALEKAGIAVENYFASEIDKYAIAVTMHNYPNTKQLGSVIEVDGYKLPKIDLLIGGSPCQSFSFAGKRKGMSTKCETEILTLEHYIELKSEGYEFEGQSYLFWEYMRLLNEVKPKYFLLENVMMGEKWEKILSKAIGVNPIEINSALVSAQNRRRLYWTNIGMQPSGLFGDLASIIPQPKDKGILLKDILESEVDKKYYLSDKMIETKSLTSLEKSNLVEYYPCDYRSDEGFRIRENGKAPTLTRGAENSGTQYNSLVIEVNNAVEINVFDGYNNRMRTDEKCGSITQHCSRSGMTNGFKVIVPNKDNMVMQINPSTESNGKQPYQQNRVYDINGISPALCANKSDLLIKQLNKNQQKKFNPNINTDKANTLTLAQGRAGSSDEYMDAVSKIANITSHIRRLTPLECERLQTVPFGYTDVVSDSQRYRMLGNGWTVDVVSHIFSYLPKDFTI
jgi:DNA (cytosine-5)-methyltransferase 3A